MTMQNLGNAPSSMSANSNSLLSISQVALGPIMLQVPKHKRTHLFFMAKSNAIEKNELNMPIPSDEQIDVLSKNCEGLAQAWLNADVILPQNPANQSQSSPYPQDKAPNHVQTESDKTSKPWASISSLKILKVTTSGIEFVPTAFCQVIHSGINIPLPALTFTALNSFRLGKVVELETIHHPHNLKKLSIPKLKEFFAIEDAISKTEWEEGWQNLIPTVGAELGSKLSEMFQKWHDLLQNHHLYQSDSDFPII
ncbi:hypothetical protein BS47DRAFT_1364229 [Hydnum rufescens UP504]|uniref:Uncharacterized protein n=1 Tax=Hydnum rufescens UP504 TaxID=1448309 RepID=A0A9P6ASI6_9AGAM|nr:hypothetical protein BS47DRAFT_1364229 [Hydnum rufescens UP504]